MPCRQSGLSASLQCSTNTAVVSWTPAVGILTYNSSAEAIDVTDTRSCATSGPGCNISSLLCGERYRVVVSGQGRTCPSPAVDWRQITTGNHSWHSWLNNFVVDREWVNLAIVSALRLVLS